jgi:predicted  nucleic acid-binding Zn-ribbon protein
MSEERFDRLENQLTQVIQGMAVMQQNMTAMQQNMAVVEQKVSGIEQKVSGIEQKISSMQNNIDAAREDISNLRRRVESNEGTLIVTIREGFRSREIDLTENERKTRRLSRRVARLERNSDND